MAQSNHDASGMFRDYVKSFFRNRGKLLLYNLLVLLLATGVILVWPREFKSEAKIWIKIGRENSKLNPTAATGEQISIQENDREDEIKSVIDVLGSRGVVEGAVGILGPKVVLGEEPLPGQESEAKVNPVTQVIKSALSAVGDAVKSIDPIGDHEEAVQEIIKHIVVDAERKSNVVSLKYDSKSPALAQAVVQALLDQYRRDHTRIHKTEGSQNFFGEQLQTLKDRVAETSEALRRSKDEVGLASIDGHRAFLEEQMSDVGAAKMEALRRLSEARALAEELANQLASQPQQIQSEERSVPNTGRDLIRSQLYDLQVQRMELESKMKNHPQLAAIKKQEQDARSELAGQTTAERKEVSKSLNDVHQALLLELAKVKSAAAGHQAMLEELDGQETVVLAKMSTLNKSEVGIRQKERNVELAVKDYMSYAEKFEDSRVDNELDKTAISNIGIAQAPTLELKPVSPSKALIAALALAAMLFGSIAIVAANLILDDSIHDRNDLADIFEGTVLVSVPNQRQYRHVLH